MNKVHFGQSLPPTSNTVHLAQLLFAVHCTALCWAVIEILMVHTAICPSAIRKMIVMIFLMIVIHKRADI